MWKEPSADFNLSSATWGQRAPFSVHGGFGQNAVCTPIESSKVLSQEAQRRARSWNLGLWLGGPGGRTQRCAAGKFGSVCEDFVVHSHEAHFLPLDFCPRVWGFKGKHWLLLLGDRHKFLSFQANSSEIILSSGHGLCKVDPPPDASETSCLAVYLPTNLTSEFLPTSGLRARVLARTWKPGGARAHWVTWGP